MTTIPRLAETAIRDRVGLQSFERGRAYFRDGSIHSTRRRGMTLEARCHGSRSNDYRVSATFKPKGLHSAECSCPVGDGGYCKHLAAMLLTWGARPEAFVEVEETGKALERRTKAELIALVLLMLRRVPDLESLLETTEPATEAGKKKGPPSVETYRRLAVEAFQTAGDDDDDYDEYGIAAEIAAGLDTLVEVGDALLESGDPLGASAVYRGILAGVIDEYGSVQDENGDIHGPVGDCVDGLGRCLGAVANDEDARGAILRSLFDLDLFDLMSGGIELGGDPIGVALEHATVSDRAAMVSWAREAAGGKDVADRKYARESLGRLIIELGGPEAGDSLATLREFGMARGLIERLIELGRVDEAEKEVEKAGFTDHEVGGIAGLFDKHGQPEAAERLVLNRARKNGRPIQLLEWLRDRLARRNDTAGALKYAGEIFELRPGLQEYRAVRKLAEADPASWSKLRVKLLKLIAKAGPSSVVVRIHLDEGLVDDAIAGLDAIAKKGKWGFDAGLALEVARAAETSRPSEAIRLYRAHAERLIENRHRAAYAEACKTLAIVKKLYTKAGDKAGWARDLFEIQARFRTLRALFEEMAAAKL